MAAAIGKFTIIYDGECALCRTSLHLIEWLDWGNLFASVRYQDLTDHELDALGLTREAVTESVHLIDSRGRVRKGADAVRWILVRLPLGVPIGLLMYLPGIYQLSELVYAFVSRHRRCLNRA